MRLYNNKLIWKISLILSALLLIFISFIYLNSIINKVNAKDKNRVERWAIAIKRKAKLVELTNTTFDELRNKEEEKVKLWAKASENLLSNNDLNSNCDLTFMTDILHNNKDIPVILTDNKQKIINSLNINLPTDSLKKVIVNWRKKNTPIKVDIGNNEFQYIYYSDSKRLAELEYQRDSLINSFNYELINNTNLVPVLFISDRTKKVIASNYKTEEIKDSILVSQKINYLKTINFPIKVSFSYSEKGTIYFDKSKESTKLRYFPVVVVIVVSLFILVAYLIFSTFRKAEQNQVWAGMAKETAHQLGTPISSLMAWTQLLELKGIDKEDLNEMNKDINRLEKVANRFSKIGSKTVMENVNIVTTIKSIYDYLINRVPNNVTFNFNKNSDKIIVPHNPELFEWVIENLCKNAIDAMKAKGKLKIDLFQIDDFVYIDISDSGMGIPQKQWKQIFNPGFSTKKRGWGLGLSLTKRIIEEYHKGKIFVKHSEIDNGSTIRIKLHSK